MSTLNSDNGPDGHPTFREALGYWLQLGCISFGGPAGQIAMMHRGLVEQRRWISESHFLQATQFAMVLPGPEAQQLATYIGWRLHGILGGIAAGGLFVLPSAFLLYMLSVLFVLGQDAVWMTAVIRGLNAAVIALIVSAVIRIGRRTLATPGLWGLAIVAFVLIFFFDVSFLAIVVGAAILGWLGSRLLPGQFPTGSSHVAVSKGSSDPSSAIPAVVVLRRIDSRSWRRTLVTIVLGGLLWAMPTLLVVVSLGWDSTLSRQGVFFSKAAIVTFGGAYAVLPYVAQQAVDTYRWLTPEQMMSGLALAETTPGPLIMVLQFVGFVGAWQYPDGLHPWVAATLGAVLTTWVTFVPSFLFIFVGGPYVERLETMPRLLSLLQGISAAVVGVMFSLGIRFGLDATRVSSGAPDWFVILLALSCLLLLVRTRVSIPWLILAAGLTGWVVSWLIE